MSVAEYRESDKQPIVVVLDHVRSLYNVGSVFRSSDAFRIEGVVLCGITAQAVEQCEGSTMLQDFHTEVGQKYAIVLGNEVKGVQQQVVDMCDGCLEIPQYGTKHSLNVSVAAGIVLWHLSKK